MQTDDDEHLAEAAPGEFDDDPAREIITPADSAGPVYLRPEVIEVTPLPPPDEIIAAQEALRASAIVKLTQGHPLSPAEAALLVG